MMRLTELANVCRRAGLRTVEVDGWQTRGRTGDGGRYQPGRPTHIMVHHTAGRAGASAASEVNYMVNVSPYPPVANLYVARDGAVWVMAAGPSNTNGRGKAPWAGFVADNDMNRHAIGIEIGNNGIGEPYPEVQQDALVTLCAYLADHYNIALPYIRAHHEWAPGRKIDPAGPSRWATGSNQWNMPSFRYSVSQRLPLDPLATTPEDDVITARFWSHPDYASTYLIDGANAARVSPALFRDLYKAGVPHVIEADWGMLDWCEARSGVERGDELPNGAKKPGVWTHPQPAAGG